MKLLIDSIRAYHKTLTKEIIAEKPLVEQLRWLHPEDRPGFAYKAYKEGLLTKEQAREFVKIG